MPPRPIDMARMPPPHLPRGASSGRSTASVWGGASQPVPAVAGPTAHAAARTGPAAAAHGAVAARAPAARLHHHPATAAARRNDFGDDAGADQGEAGIRVRHRHGLEEDDVADLVEDG